MNRDEVLAAMLVAGLIGPRVLLHRTATGNVEFLLTCGLPEARRTKAISVAGKKSCKASKADVDAAISLLGANG